MAKPKSDLEEAVKSATEAIDDACANLTLEDYGEFLEEVASYIEVCEDAQRSDVQRREEEDANE